MQEISEHTKKEITLATGDHGIYLSRSRVSGGEKRTEEVKNLQ
jgi:hypothetical protein